MLCIWQETSVITVLDNAQFVEIARYSFLLMMVLPLMRVSSFIVLYAKASHDTGTLPLKCYTRSSAKKHLFKMRFRSFGI
jgi:hypothetical protein